MFLLYVWSFAYVFNLVELIEFIEPEGSSELIETDSLRRSSRGLSPEGNEWPEDSSEPNDRLGELKGGRKRRSAGALPAIPYLWFFVFKKRLFGS